MTVGELILELAKFPHYYPVYLVTDISFEIQEQRWEEIVDVQIETGLGSVGSVVKVCGE